MIKILLSIIILSVPCSLIYLNITHPEANGRYLFNAFVIFIMLERIWETFFTSKEKDIRRFHGDWTLVLTTFMYFIAGLVMIWEFFYINRINIFVTIVGVIIFFLSGALRFWGVRTLGDQWAIHAVGQSKIKSEKHTLIKSGPYKYIRHPIYLGIIFELIGIAVISNTFYALIFIFCINAPLYIIRAIYEEKTSKERFGEGYIIYKNEVPFMIPLKIFYRNKDGL